MADLALTGSTVIAGADATQTEGTLAGGILAGRCVYQDSNGQYALAIANAESTADVAGISLSPGAVGQPVEIQTGGTLTVNSGTPFTVGETYCLSSSGAGGGGILRPVGDLVTNDYVTVIGIATSTTALKLAILASGVQVP